MESIRHAFIQGKKQMINIEEASPGTKYSCPGCGQPLIVKNQGLIREHHFAHLGPPCEHGGETALHMFCKYIISISHWIRLASGKIFWYTQVIIEKPIDAGYIDGIWYTNRAIDVMLYNEKTGETLAVEIKVTCALKDDKIEFLQKAGYQVLEIDVSDKCYREMDTHALTNLLIDGEDYKEDFLLAPYHSPTRSGSPNNAPTYSSNKTFDWSLLAIIGFLVVGIIIIYNLFRSEGSGRR